MLANATCLLPRLSVCGHYVFWNALPAIDLFRYHSEPFLGIVLSTLLGPSDGQSFHWRYQLSLTLSV